MRKFSLLIVLPLFLTVTVNAQSFKVAANGNVGIGTANPLYRLDLSGDARITGNIYLNSASNFLGTTGDFPVTFKVNNLLAGFTGKSGNSNVSFGYGALSSPSLTGVYNIAVGNSALILNTSGSSNTAIGYNALYSNTYGDNNTANGYNALRLTTYGEENTANGSYALYSNTIGYNNTANGFYALYSNTDGTFNTADGSRALYSNTTGYHNTAIGYYADVSTGNLNNATAIGYLTKATASNQVRIGNSSVTSIGGYAAWSNISDGRIKKNIRANVPGLAFINRLQPVTYNLDLDAMDNLLNIDKSKRNERDTLLTQEQKQKLENIEREARDTKQKQIQTGFVAQDVEKTAKSIGYDFSGVDVDEMGIYGLRYSEFVVPLVKAVQELSEQNNRLQVQIDELQKQINTLKGNDLPIVAEPAHQQSPAAPNNTEETPDIKNPAVTQSSVLYQNAPNPFTHSTEIKYYLPDNVSTALLCIYDLQGRELKQITLSGSGAGSHILHGHELHAGIYLYSLLVNGLVVDTKRMTLTK